jgi:hypothetical protein
MINYWAARGAGQLIKCIKCDYSAHLFPLFVTSVTCTYSHANASRCAECDAGKQQCSWLQFLQCQSTDTSALHPSYPSLKSVSRAAARAAHHAPALLLRSE